MEKYTCEKCGKPLQIKPRDGEWGKQYQGKKGMYYSFIKCNDCNWSKTSDPNPKKPKPKIISLEERLASKFNEIDKRLDNLENLAFDETNTKLSEIAENELNIPF